MPEAAVSPAIDARYTKWLTWAAVPGARGIRPLWAPGTVTQVRTVTTFEVVVLFDRATERETLRGLLARAADGFSGTLVLRGEAGVGKTALLEDTVAAAAANGSRRPG